MCHFFCFAFGCYLGGFQCSQYIYEALSTRTMQPTYDSIQNVLLTRNTILIKTGFLHIPLRNYNTFSCVIVFISVRILSTFIAARMQTFFKVSRLNGGFSIEKEIKMNVVADFNQVLGRF